MRNSREPILTPVRITSLRPTQITVGLREVERKRSQWRGEGKHGGMERGAVAGEFRGGVEAGDARRSGDESPAAASTGDERGW